MNCSTWVRHQRTDRAGVRDTNTGTPRSRCVRRRAARAASTRAPQGRMAGNSLQLVSHQRTRAQLGESRHRARRRRPEACRSVRDTMRSLPGALLRRAGSAKSSTRGRPFRRLCSPRLPCQLRGGLVQVCLVHPRFLILSRAAAARECADRPNPSCSRGKNFCFLKVH